MRGICYIGGVLVLLLLSNSCIKNNPDPSWIEVNKWTLLANPDLSGSEGELTHNFSEAWVYIDDQVIGVFEVPFKIPVLKSGNVNIKIYPAVKNNGISATKKIYPFTTVFEINAELIKNQTLSINPTTQYKSLCLFWIENFENSPSFKIQDDPNTKAHLGTGNDPNILEWGNYYGLVNLDAVDSTWIAYTNDMNLPKGQEVYLEIDYHNTNALITGVLDISPSGVVNNQNIQLNPQSSETVKWKKIYIDLKEIVSNSASNAYFKQSFQAVIDNGDSEGQIIIDNIKVIHY